MYKSKDIRKFDDPTNYVVKEGKFCYGTYNKTIKNINLLHVDTPYKLKLPKALLKLRLDQWEAIQFCDGRYLVMAAILSKISGFSEVKIVDLKDNTVIEQVFFPSLKNIHVGESMYGDFWRVSTDKIKFRISNRLEFGEIHLDLKTDELECHIRGIHINDPLVIVHPFSENRGLYSHKSLMRGYGYFKHKGEVTKFNQPNWFIVDDHKGYYPMYFNYDWVSGAVIDKNRMVGFNLTRNQIKNPEIYNENCLWVGKDIELLPAVEFSRPFGDKGPWYISDENKRVNLIFVPNPYVNIGFNKIKPPLRYYVPSGKVSGYIKRDNNEKVIFNDMISWGEIKKGLY